MTLENLLKDVHRAAEQKARIDTCVELYLEGSLPFSSRHPRAVSVRLISWPRWPHSKRSRLNSQLGKPWVRPRACVLFFR